MSDSSITTIVSGLITITTLVVGFLVTWVRLKYGVDKAEKAATAAAITVASMEDKIDENTRITKDGAKQASVAVTSADTIADTINNKLNGEIDSSIKEAIDPLRKALDDDDRSIKIIATKLENLSAYVHERNHNILTALQNQANQIGSILQMIQNQKSK